MFVAQGFPKAGQLLLQLAEVVERGEDDKRQTIFDAMLLTFRIEYGTDSDFLELFDFINEIMIDSVLNKKVGFTDKLKELEPFVDSMRKGATIMGTIAGAFLKAANLSKEERYYANLLVHIIDVEGQFDEACRIIYVLYKTSLGENIRYSDAVGLKVAQISDIMRQLTAGKSDILFLGWQKGHLRNCMAHVRLEYNASNDTMHFNDIDTRTGEPTYNKTWSFQQCLKFINMTHGVSFVFLHCIMILEVRDMAFAAKPFGQN